MLAYPADLCEVHAIYLAGISVRRVLKTQTRGIFSDLTWIANFHWYKPSLFHGRSASFQPLSLPESEAVRWKSNLGVKVTCIDRQSDI